MESADVETAESELVWLESIVVNTMETELESLLVEPELFTGIPFNSTVTKGSGYEFPLFILGNILFSSSLFKLKINKHFDDIGATLLNNDDVQ